MSYEYAILVKNKTRLEVLIERFNTKAQAEFYIERSGGNFKEYEIEHDRFQESLSFIQRKLSKVIKNKIVDRSFLPSFLFNETHLLIVVGQDGLVANTAKYVNGIPMIAVNPDTDRYDGLLLPFQPNNFINAVEKVIKNDFKAREVRMAEANLSDGQRLLAFNDLFIGASSHVSARYKITYRDVTENHSSSGIIVSTQAGSTGWLSSIFNMTFGMQQFIQKSDSKKKIAKLKEHQLMFVIREPFESKKTQAGLTAGIVTEQNKLIIESFMPTNGVIFSDGVETDFLSFNSGAIATIGVAKETARLVV
ncbi:hypothetical protein [Desertivirga brevis]|uniref:hypothetical protein n=1 Tax=Desertivirga brevis TaxID=2810310 RepID=UPI001A95BD1F|nr:hypothetical protein [Pedobacter sp. SYSU D00873]